MPYYQVSGEDYGGIWVKLGVIGGENSRKPVFGFRLLEEKKFCKGLKRYLRTVLSDYVRFDDALLSYFDFN